VSMVPYIGTIACIIRHGFQIHSEIKRSRGEWEAVMQRLADIASLIISVGEFCQANDLSEQDLVYLRDALQPLQSDLEEIRGVLSECARIRGLKKVLLRSEILDKIGICDRKLSHALQIFQTKLSLHTHLLHVRATQAPKVTTAIATDSVGLSTFPMTSKPPTPQNFFGREAELAYIVETIFNNVGTCPARIAILGPGGYGKTTLANAVLNHDHVVTHFGHARYFVTCENASMPSALLIEIARALGVLNGSNISWSYIHAFFKC